jgi:sulfatase modifying factor 1
VACLRGEGGALADTGGADFDTGLDATTSAEAEASDDATAMAPVDASESSVVEASDDAEPEAGGDVALPPSCAPVGPGMTNCGPGGSGTESCCTSLEVSGGTFYRTYNTSWSLSGPPDGGWTDEADPATVSTLRLDKYDVTVGRFRQFVNAVSPADGGAGWMPAAGSGKHTHLNGGKGLSNTGLGGGYESGWNPSDSVNIGPTNMNLASCSPDSTWTNSASAQENLPINCVNWYEAYAFCIWDGGFLPSEAESEYAAAGGSQQREYPWGSAAPGTTNQYAIYECYYPSVRPNFEAPGPGSCTAGVTNIAPVGTPTLGAGLWGQLDLAGNMQQWSLDWASSIYIDPCTDCALLGGGMFVTAASARTVHGGWFWWDVEGLLPPVGSSAASIPGDALVGFRCARTP